MSGRNIIRIFLLIAVCAFVSAVTVLAQPTNPQDPADKARKVKKEPIKQAYKEWITKDVAYIITPEEKKAFNQLTTDEERENFIETFWRRRDPDPDTDENEFKEEFYERIAYANEHYTSGIPGWKTDRGRIYISFGKPDSVESHPSGGSYNRPSYEGGGSTTTYPFEVWFYRHLDGVGDGIEIEFVDPTGTGEYRIARNANEKDALLMVPGAGLTLNEELGLSSKADRISGINAQNNHYMREQDSPFRRMEIIANLQRPPAVKYNDLKATLEESPVIDNDPLDFDLRVDYFRQSDERVVVAFTLQTENKELTFEDKGGIQQATMNIHGRIMAVAGKRSGIFEDAVTASATASELAEAKDKKSVYQKAYALTPGIYKVDVVVRDVKSGKRGIRSLGFTVPKFEPEKLATSTMILAARLYETTDRDIGQQFVIGDKKVIPNLSGVYQKGQEVGVYLQIYNAGIDQTTLRPSVDVTYVLTKEGKEILRQPEDWKGLTDSGQRLTLARMLSTAQMAPGSYELKIKIADRVSTQAIEQSAKFTVTQ